MEATTLGELLDRRLTLLVVLRHFGRLLDRELVGELADADAVAADRHHPQVVFVHQGSVEQGPMFIGGLMPDAEAIADPDGELFEAVGIDRGSLRQVFGLRTWRRALQALTKGHFVNRKIGDPWTRPTIMAVRDGWIVWEHRGRHAGDHPDVAAIAREVERT